MSDDDKKQSADQGASSSAEDGKGTAGGTEPDWKAEAEKWKDLARKHESAAKMSPQRRQELLDIERSYHEIEDSKKTETEKLTEAKAAADKAAASAQGELARLRVAMRKGLTEAQAKRLVGETEEELEADADELLASFGHKDAGGDAGKPTRPKERLRSGAAPEEEPDETDPRKLADMVPRR